MSTPFAYRHQVAQVAAAFSLDPALIEAVCLVESSGDPTAWNPEPRYRYFWDVRQQRPFRRVTDAEVAAKVPPVDFPALAGDRDQEWWGQQASWGLMQVMGAVAREHGCRLPYLPALVRHERLALEYGARALRVCLAWAGGDVAAALAAFNGGRTADNGPGVAVKRNQVYVDKALRQLAVVRAARSA